MNEELLKRVAQCAPKEMCAFLGHNARGVSFDPDGTPAFVSLISNDIMNGSGIVAMLDAMEQVGLRPYVCQKIDGSGYFAAFMGSDGTFDGATRAEAVARAFCAVFEN